MVNLRSGGTPDLTKEYVPSRRKNEKTPEQQTQDHRSLPTPITNRKAAPGAFEPDETIAEEQSDESNVYEDPVEGIISEMSGNAGGPSGRNDNSSASEETRMRLEIARLQHEVERMKTSRGDPAGDEMGADLAEYLQRKGKTSVIMKVLEEFRSQVRLIKRPIVLTGSINYPMWREEILLAAEQSETDDILEGNGLGENATMDMQRFWKERNLWLYNYMWSAIAPQAKAHFTIPKESKLSAYALWTIIEDNFSERPAVRRTRLFEELIGMTSKSKGSDRAFIERLIAIRTDYIRLGYKIEDVVFFDRLLTGVNRGWASFIKNRMDQIDKDNSRPLEEDFMGLCRDILLRLPTAENSSTESTRNPINNAQDKDKKAKDKEKDNDKDKDTESKPERRGNDARTCYHCQKVGHIQTDCWKKYPEKRPSNSNSNTNRNKDKDKDAENTGAAPVHNVMEQVFCIKEKAYASGQTGKDTWILDSGSGAHATPHRDLVVAKPQKVKVMLEMADGTVVPAAAIGDTKIPVEGADMLLNDVRYVPKLEVNLMSMGKLVRQGYTYKQLTYGNNHAMLIMSPDRMFSFTARLNENDIYEMERPVTYRDLIRFAMPNGDFEPANTLRAKDDTILALPERNDTKVIELTMMQWHQKARASESRGYHENGGGSTPGNEDYRSTSFTVLQGLCPSKNDTSNLRTYDTSCQAGNEILHRSGRGWKNTFRRE
ncbi:uncharacterized protein BDCG_00728 [Blastomyces dermatitidis ER-3]|uniref:CCHC-type domain-containing protein n=1 Tax=Ajellomyces dermatitidis (strain ER-3 / ATCC MYA-2586) TaxID=559297 RepID=A0ABX2VQN3_AJEDR|nr:uncharacterized protein BDCG_00728 [Blastomyces dermatitidis ER-3]OAS99554.1 hypothetical protein BDCG_00728 [Blastomyces dermatitidis ER-3]